MKANRAMNEALYELTNELRPLCFDGEKAAQIIQRWAKNHFEQFGVTAHVDGLEEERGGAGLKAHLVRAAVIKAAIEVARVAGFGESEVKQPWADRVAGRGVDYAPAFLSQEHIPVKELRLSFVCLKRKPDSWYHWPESDEQWFEKLVETKKEKA